MNDSFLWLHTDALSWYMSFEKFEGHVRAVGYLQEAMLRYAPNLRNWLAAQRVTGVQGSSGAILALVHLPLCCLANSNVFSWRKYRGHWMAPIWGDQTMEMYGHYQGFPLFNSALVWVGNAVTPAAYLLEGRWCISHVESELKVSQYGR